MVSGGDPDPSIAHLDSHLVLVRRADHVNGMPGRVLERVGQQISEDLFEPEAIPHAANRRYADDDVDPSFRSRLAQARRDARHDFIECCWRERE